VSFGSKLDDFPTVAPYGQTTAVLAFVPEGNGRWVQEAEVYLEDLNNRMTILKLSAVCPLERTEGNSSD
jgi:hypothetical protein